MSDNKRVVLNYGGFSCTGEHAVQQAFILSTAEAALHRIPSDRMDIGEILLEYIDGRINLPEAIAALNEDLDPD